MAISGSHGQIRPGKNEMVYTGIWHMSSSLQECISCVYIKTSLHRPIMRLTLSGPIREVAGLVN